jgi:hypothetical protein
MKWVRGPTVNSGNERAGGLAKTAAGSRTPCSFGKCPLSFLKGTLKTDVLNSRNVKCEACEKGSITRKLFFPSVDTGLQASYTQPDFVLTQFLTDHGKFGAYFHRFTVQTDRQYLRVRTCQESAETVEHILFDRPVYGKICTKNAPSLL